ncbi:hypothetical protein [Rhodococcus sp. ACT016]|uniref:hypothetical protein n=1 Tax=Rhodococcus sp. ACT016 TaxID=3134808 RepID=UPI003D2A25C4
MTNPFKSRMAIRVILGLLSCAQLGVAFHTLFSDAPADWDLTWPLMLLIAACLLQLSNLDRQRDKK